MHSFLIFIHFERIDEFEDRSDNRSLQLEIEILRLEENTWGLLQALMSSVSPSILPFFCLTSHTEPEKPTRHLPNPPKNSCSKTPIHPLPHSYKPSWIPPLSSPSSSSSANGCKKPRRRLHPQKPTRVTGNSPNIRLCRVYVLDTHSGMVWLQRWILTR